MVTMWLDSDPPLPPIPLLLLCESPLSKQSTSDVSAIATRQAFGGRGGEARVKGAPRWLRAIAVAAAEATVDPSGAMVWYCGPSVILVAVFEEKQNEIINTLF